MSGVAVVRYKLAANANLIAVVPATRILSGQLPLNTTLPAITVTHISGVTRPTVRMKESSFLITDRVQVSVLAKSYATVKSILSLVRAALPNSKGSINSVTVDSILPDIDGPDLYDYEFDIFQQSKDYMVRYGRSA